MAGAINNAVGYNSHLVGSVPARSQPTSAAADLGVLTGSPPQSLDNDDSRVDDRNKDKDSALASVASGAVITSFVLGNFKSWGLDRGRIALAGYLNAKQNNLKFKTTVLDMFRGPTLGNVPIDGGKWNLWQRSFRLSNTIGTGLGVLGAFVAITGISAGVEEDGGNGILNTKRGRTGLIQAAYSAWGASFGLVAATRFRDPGQGFWEAFAGASWLAKPSVRNLRWGVGMAVGALTIANELGYLDKMNDWWKKDG